LKKLMNFNFIFCINFKFHLNIEKEMYAQSTIDQHSQLHMQ